MRKAMLLLTVFAFAGSLWAADLFVGIWKLDVAKSTANGPGLLHKSETINIVAQENGAIFTFDGVDAEGKAFHGTWSGQYDGTYYPFIGNPGADMAAAKQISANTLVFIYKKDGKEVANWRQTVSKNGSTMAVTGRGKDAKGQDFTKDLIYNKQ
jgi:hypothetical protein